MALAQPTVVIVAHENDVVEAGILHILGAWPGFVTRAHARTERPEAGSAAEPHLVVLDLESGIARAKATRQSPGPHANVMVVVMAGQETQVRSALEAGVKGCVMMGCSANELVNAALSVAAGRRYLCNAATLQIAVSLATPQLTQRESEVLALVFRGASNKAIAREMDISVGTVKSHMRGLLTKLGASCRTEALWIAAERGLITRPANTASPATGPATVRPIEFSRKEKASGLPAARSARANRTPQTLLAA